MKIIKKYCILFLLLLCSFKIVTAHPFYVSICQIDFNKDQKTLEISIKIFADDLLLGLENQGYSDIFLGEKKENMKADRYIQDYLHEKLEIAVNGEKKKFSFVGKEMEDNVVWTYLEIGSVPELKFVEIQCDLLTEVLETQKNIIQINNGVTIKNLLLHKNKTAGSVVF